MRIKTRLLAVAPLLAITTPTVGAGSSSDLSCEPQWTPIECYNELRQNLEDERKQQIEQKTKGKARTKAAEDLTAAAKKATPSTQGEGGALRSFLAPFLGNFGFEGVEDSGGRLTFEKTWIAADEPALENQSNLRFSLRGTILDPEVFESLDMELRESLDEDASGLGLTETLGDFDAVDVELTVNLESRNRQRRYGRDPRNYHDLYEDIFGGALKAVNRLTDSTPPFELYTKLEKMRPLLGHEDPANMPFDGIQEKLEEHAAEQGREDGEEIAREAIEQVKKIEQWVVEAASDMDDLVLDLEDSWNQERQRLDNLVANQPQLGGGLTLKQRDGLTGPDEWAANFRYEVGLHGNVNDFLTWTGKNCDDNTLTCLTNYLKERPKAALNANRFSFSLSFTDTDEFSFALPDRDFGFNLGPSEKWTGAASYGRYIRGLRLFDPEGEDGTRFDLEAKYDEPSGDEMRRSRFVATATLTQRLGGRRRALRRVDLGQSARIPRRGRRGAQRPAGIHLEADPEQERRQEGRLAKLRLKPTSPRHPGLTPRAT